MRTTNFRTVLVDPIRHFLAGCREALDAGATVFETRMRDAAYVPITTTAPFDPERPTIISGLRSLVQEKGLDVAWYRLPRTTIAENSEAVSGSSGRCWPASEPGAFLCGQVFAQPSSRPTLEHMISASGIELGALEKIVLSALSDVSGDQKTGFEIPATSFKARLSAVAKFAFRHTAVLSTLSEKIRESKIDLVQDSENPYIREITQ